MVALTLMQPQALKGIKPSSPDSLAAVPREKTMPENHVHVKVLDVTLRTIESGSQALYPDYLSA